jgi:hypothetical protein
VASQSGALSSVVVPPAGAPALGDARPTEAHAIGTLRT